MASRYIGDVIALGRVLFAIALASMLATSAFAQTAPGLTVISESNDPGGRAQQIVVHSALVGRDFVVVVSPPPISGSTQVNEKLPAIYALDGGNGIAGPTAQKMIGAGMMSPAYVVSVGYGEGQSSGRNTDLLYRPVTEGGVTFGGGGAKFESFLSEELRPFLEARYPLDPAKAILFGHSLGGLFAVNVLAHAPNAFEGYVIASPSLWMDRQVLDKLSRAVNKDECRVFIAVGEQEQSRMLDGVNQLWALLPAGIKAGKKVFAGEGDISTDPLLVQSAFRWMLPSPGGDRAAISPSAEDLRPAARHP